MIDKSRVRREVYFEAVRSRGPGGQNVNRTSSAALLYWSYLYSELLTEDDKRRVAMKLATRINSEGLVYIRADEYRDLERNKDAALDRLVELVNQALHIPKKRRKTKPTRASQERRKDSKRKRGEVKRLRGRISG